MALSDAKIRAIKATDKVQKVSDEKGLQLWISPAGNKVWNLAYRFDGKQKKLSIGPYPEIGLGDARRKRDEARALLAEGMDPAEQKQRLLASSRDARANTFAVLADELLERKRQQALSLRTLEKVEWLLDFARPGLGARPIADITPAEVLDVLRAVEKRGRLETAKRLRSVIGEVFRYAIATARATNDPSGALRGALLSPKVTHRSAITDPVAFGALMRAIEGFNGQPTTVAALKLLALLFPRPGELRQAEWREFDLEGAVWTIPAGRMKMRQEHRIPLPRQALAILGELHTVTGRSPLVFPGYGMSGGEGRKVAPKPISENTLNGALRRMGYSADEMTSHGFRATASTLLNESGRFSADAIERALAHQESDAVRRAYARGEHWKERVAMAEWWADQIDALRDGAKIIPLVRHER
jgi:integrase